MPDIIAESQKGVKPHLLIVQEELEKKKKRESRKHANNETQRGERRG